MKEEVLKFIRDHQECVLATIAPSGQPEAATVLFAVDDNFTFYFGTKKEYRKYKNLLENGNVAVVVGTSGKDPRTAQIEGKVEMLNDEHGITAAKEVLKQNPAMVPFLSLPLVYLQLKPTWLRYLDETKGEIDNFQQVLP